MDRWCTWLVFWVLLASNAQGQEGLDSTRFWQQRISELGFGSHHPRLDTLSDGNILVSWGVSGVFPYSHEPYAAVYRPTSEGGEILVPAQAVLLHESLAVQSVVADPAGGFMVVTIWWQSAEPFGPLTTTIHYHHISVDYERGGFQSDWTVADGPFQEISLANGPPAVVNQGRLLLALEAHEDPFRYYIQVLDLADGRLLRGDPLALPHNESTAAISFAPVPGGFFFYCPHEVGLVGLDGDLLWTRESGVWLHTPRVVSDGDKVHVVGCLARRHILWATYDAADGQGMGQDTLWSWNGYNTSADILFQDSLLFVAATLTPPGVDNLWMLRPGGERVASTRLTGLDDRFFTVHLVAPNLVRGVGWWSEQSAWLFHWGEDGLDEDGELVLPGYLNDDGYYDVDAPVLYTGGGYHGTSYWDVWVSTWRLLPRETALAPPPAAAGEIPLSSHPNPFNSRTVVEFTLTEPTRISLAAYNLLGQRVLELGPQWTPPGSRRQELDFGGLASGPYVVEVRGPAGPLAQVTVICVK